MYCGRLAHHSLSSAVEPALSVVVVVRFQTLAPRFSFVRQRIQAENEEKARKRIHTYEPADVTPALH